QQRGRRLQPVARSGSNPLARGCHARLLGYFHLSARACHGRILVHRFSADLAPIDGPVKIAVLKLRNLSGRPRRISVTGYWEWVLGDLRQKNLLHVQTEVDSQTGALLSRNFYNTDFSQWIAFLDVDDPTRTLTGDRNEFLGRNGALSTPAALKRVRLSGKVGAGLDPCGALQVTFDLPDEQERETIFRLGAGCD